MARGVQDLAEELRRGIRRSEPERGDGAPDAEAGTGTTLPPKILNITTPQVGHFPLIALRPFSWTSSTASAISFCSFAFNAINLGHRKLQWRRTTRRFCNRKELTGAETGASTAKETLRPQARKARIQLECSMLRRHLHHRRPRSRASRPHPAPGPMGKNRNPTSPDTCDLASDTPVPSSHQWHPWADNRARAPGLLPT